MSRIGKKPIIIPDKTEITKSNGLINVKGPLGELSRKFRPEVEIEIGDSEIILKPSSNKLFANALWGTYASHLQNMIQGVNSPFEKKLVIEGVGFRVQITDGTLVLNIGFSHQVTVPIPDDVKVEVVKNVISLSSIDKESVGSFSAYIRSLKKPEPYKGKGIRYENEVVRRKQGKKAV